MSRRTLPGLDATVPPLSEKVYKNENNEHSNILSLEDVREGRMSEPPMVPPFMATRSRIGEHSVTHSREMAQWLVNIVMKDPRFPRVYSEQAAAPHPRSSSWLSSFFAPPKRADLSDVTHLLQTNHFRTAFVSLVIKQWKADISNVPVEILFASAHSPCTRSMIIDAIDPVRIIASFHDPKKDGTRVTDPEQTRQLWEMFLSLTNDPRTSIDDINRWIGENDFMFQNKLWVSHIQAKFLLGASDILAHGFLEMEKTKFVYEEDGSIKTDRTPPFYDAKGVLKSDPIELIKTFDRMKGICKAPRQMKEKSFVKRFIKPLENPLMAGGSRSRSRSRGRKTRRHRFH